MPDPICFVSIGFQSNALDSITANIYNLNLEPATVDGPDSITVFPNDAALSTYYFYNGKVGNNEPCDDCPYSVLAEDVTQKVDSFQTKFRIMTPIEEFKKAEACGYSVGLTQRAAVIDAINRGLEDEVKLYWSGNDPESALCEVPVEVKDERYMFDDLIGAAGAYGLFSGSLAAVGLASAMLAF